VSSWVVVHIRCDDCERTDYWTASCDTEGAQELREAGWRIGTGASDLCPSCVAKRQG
jgi:hypothetical protein